VAEPTDEEIESLLALAGLPRMPRSALPPLSCWLVGSAGVVVTQLFENELVSPLKSLKAARSRRRDLDPNRT